MAVYNIIYGGTADTYARQNDAVYAVARGSTLSTAANVASISSFLENSFVAGPTYYCAQVFLTFDTSSLPAGPGTGSFKVVSAGTVTNTNADTLRFREVSTLANKIAGASLSALTLHSDPGTFMSSSGTQYTAAISNVAAIPRSATFRVVIHTVGEENGTTPTGLNRCGISLADDAGTTVDPYLQIYLGSPWAFVGVSNEVAVATTAHALVTTGISGTLQAGDLLVACITSRIASTTSVTLPTGGEWTLVSEQKNNNTATNTTAAASGLMAYCVRGASNPNLTFTHPVAPSQAQGRIVAYRNVNITSPKDTQTSFTTTSVTAVSGTGLTTTQIEDLIVAMACGGQEATWSAFNATDPAGASGATDTTSAPTTTWIERADSAVITGADGSLAIFDAVKLTSGATGSLTATASLQALHVVIAGAFKITARIADAWNVEDKSATLTLSNSDKTATASGAGDAVRSTTKQLLGTAGKFYAEFYLDTVISTGPAVGIKDVTSSLSVTSSGIRVIPSTGSILNDATTIGSIGSAVVSADIICLAIDMGAERIWFRKHNGLWNNDGAANPATGTNGLDISSLANNNYGLWFLGSAGRVATLRTKVADFTYYGPVGFTSWMGEALPAAPAGDGVGSASGVGAASAQGAAFALAAGTGTATGATSATGSTLALAAGTGTATGATSAVGQSIVVAAGGGTASGTGAASATGALIGTGAGTAAGIGATSATGAAIGAGAGTSAGVGAASATGVAIGAGAGTAAGVGAATATGSTGVAIVSGDGTSAGTGAASAVGTGILPSAGTAAGTSTAAGTGRATGAFAGSAAGVGAGSATSVAIGGGAGTASGVGAATATGSSTTASAGTAAATGAASSTGSSTVASAGSAPATGTANATGRLTGAGNGSAAGIGAAAATATVTAASVGTAAGTGAALSLSDPGTTTGTATGVGTANAAGVRITTSVATAAGTGAASATGALIGAGAGSATGIGAAAATGRGVASAVGTATGTGTAAATAEGGLTVSATGSAAGTGAANAVGVRFLAGAGTAAGLGAATATGRATDTAAGSAAGVGTASATGAATGTAIGSAAGTGTGTGLGVGVVTTETVGTAVGIGTAAGTGFAILPSATADQRIIVTAAEHRLITAAAEHRTITTAVESRTIVAVAEDREIETSEGSVLLEAA